MRGVRFALSASIDGAAFCCYGAIAQLGEHLLCKQGVVGSIPTGSTSFAHHARPPCARITDLRERPLSLLFF